MVAITSPMADITSLLSAERLFLAIAIDPLNIWSTALPKLIESVDVEGDPATAGCVKQYNFPGGAYVKMRMDVVDSCQLYHKYSMIEGGGIGETLDSLVYEVTYEAFPDDDGGSRFKSIAHFVIKDNNFVKDVEHLVLPTIQAVVMYFKSFEAYLIDNPEVYA